MNAPDSVFQQQELFTAETTWFHMFRDMIESGDIARMGPQATTVYLVIKAHANFKTGCSFPGVELIAAKAGISERQVMRELKTLEDHKYIQKSKKGRSNIYRLREKVSIAGEDGRPMAVATWDYLPSSVQHAIADLKNVLVTGELVGAKIVHIECLQLNIQQNFGEGGNIQFNVSDLAKLPKEMQDALERIKNRKYKPDCGAGVV